MDELLGNRVPQSPQAEQAVLGSILTDPDCVPDVLRQVRAEYFYSPVNRDIFETVLYMFNFGRTIDLVTVAEQMLERGVLRDENTGNYLVELRRTTPTSANVGEYIAILRDKALQRELGRVGGEITKMVSEGLGSADEMLETAEREVYALRSDRSIGGLKPVSEIMQTVYTELNRLSEEGGVLPGIPTGLTDLDNRILGLNPGELVLVASRPGMGKTSIALNIALHAAKHTGKAVAVFSLEMSREQLVIRLLSGQSHVNSQKLLRGTLSTEDWRLVVSAAGIISTTRLMIDDNPSLSVADMNAECRRVRDLGLVVVDYLQLMQSAGGKKTSSGENRQNIVADISRAMKIMAKELGVPVLCLSQLSRAAEGRPNKRPMLSDLRESGAIEQDADVVIGLYREGYYNSECENPNSAEAIILKNRKGEVGTVELMWLPDFTSYVSVERRHDAL